MFGHIGFPYKCLVNASIELRPGSSFTFETITLSIDFGAMHDNSPTVNGCAFVHLQNDTNFERDLATSLLTPPCNLSNKWFDHGYSRLFGQFGDKRSHAFVFWSKRLDLHKVELTGRSLSTVSSSETVTVPFCLLLGFPKIPTISLSATFELQGQLKRQKPRASFGLCSKRSLRKHILKVVINHPPSPSMFRAPSLQRLDALSRELQEEKTSTAKELRLANTLDTKVAYLRQAKITGPPRTNTTLREEGTIAMTGPTYASPALAVQDQMQIRSVASASLERLSDEQVRGPILAHETIMAHNRRHVVSADIFASQEGRYDQLEDYLGTLCANVTSIVNRDKARSSKQTDERLANAAAATSQSLKNNCADENMPNLRPHKHRLRRQEGRRQLRENYRTGKPRYT